MKTTSPSELQSLIGTEIGTSEWLEIDQGRIDTFAEVTEDRQFIHVNKELAEKTPFGGTIAHGFLTLSLLSHFSEASGLVIEGVKMGINYGFEKIRFLAPVPTGSRVRGRFFLKSVLEKKEGNFLYWAHETGMNVIPWKDMGSKRTMQSAMMTANYFKSAKMVSKQTGKNSYAIKASFNFNEQKKENAVLQLLEMVQKMNESF